jgi:hypothetical protein
VLNGITLIDEIEQCNLVCNVGTAMAKSEQEISFMNIKNDITSFQLPFMNGVSM